jgi:hypothetical protein
MPEAPSDAGSAGMEGKASMMLFKKNIEIIF